MKRDDYYGLGMSIFLHLLVLFILGMMHTKTTEPETLGFLEVDFGPIAEGQPIQQRTEKQPEDSPEPEPDPEPEPEPKPEEKQGEEAPPEEEPVNLPDPVDPLPDEEEIQVPEPEEEPEEEVTAATEPNPEPAPEVTAATEPNPEPEEEMAEESTSDDTEADRETTGTSGNEGAGEEEQKTAPFDISGLENRSLIVSPPPVHTDNVRATTSMRVTVDHRGRVTKIIPIKKGTPALDAETRKALRRWRFSALPLNVPHVDQTGVVTFHFVLQ